MSERDCLEMEDDRRLSGEAQELITILRSRLGGIESAVWNLDAAINGMVGPLHAIAFILFILTALAVVLVWGILR